MNSRIEIGPLSIRLLTLITTMLIATLSVSAMPPHPSLERARADARSAGAILPELPKTAELHARGIDLPSETNLSEIISRNRDRDPLSAAAPFRVLALLVDFSDNASSVPASFFDSLIFDPGSGTVADYFGEISYGQIDFVTVNLPTSLGWTNAPRTYAYYVDDQYGYGNYPQNSQGLVEHLVDAVDPFVDFSAYDNDGNGYLDVLLVIHAGTGAELSGQASDMWSHKWGITPRSKDGVYISDYTVQPEFWNSAGDMTIGVYCHELGHGFGLPDLYDTDLTSNGIGNWGIMAYGSWNGSSGDSPAHPCAWSRIRLGVSVPINISSNVSALAVNAVENGGSIFRVWNAGASNNEYFLVENRQPVGYDAALPSSGLLIWHIDNAKGDNDQEWYPGQPVAQHFLVALEQADGNYELEHGNGTGDAADCYPGSSNNTSFGASSFPSSDSYLDGQTFVNIENITPSAATMYVDITVSIAADAGDNNGGLLPNRPELRQNYPNPFNPSTSIEFSLRQPAQVTLDIFNLLGRKVTTLWDGRIDGGTTVVIWDGTDRNGTEVSSGVYVYRLTSDGNAHVSRKMVLLK